ncbi:MAG: glycosyltransferase [Pseudomonadota bacterium]
MTAGAQTLPEVSVITPAWKSAAFIGRAIASVIAQESVRWEMVIVDDASPDDSTHAAILKAAAGDPRIVYDRLPENGGPSAARNRAIALSRAPYIAVLDDDDTMEPNRLAVLRDAAIRHEADIVVDNMLAIRPGVSAMAEKRFLDLPQETVDALPITLETYIDPRTEIRFGASLGYLKPLFRKDALLERQISYDGTLRNSEDFYLIAELLAQDAKMILLPDALYNYTIREGSTSYRLSSDQAAKILKADNRFREAYSSMWTSATRAASDRQNRQRENACAFAYLVDALKTRRPDRAASLFVTRPKSAPHMTRELLRIAGEKLFA